MGLDGEQQRHGLMFFYFNVDHSVRANAQQSVEGGVFPRLSLPPSIKLTTIGTKCKNYGGQVYPSNI